MDDAVSKKCAGKHIITIATHEPEEEMDSGAAELDNDGDSIPDAWIVDKERCEYCLLIECKRGGNEIVPEQLQRHARRWFGMDAADVHRVDLTWQDVLKVVEQELQFAQKENHHERKYIPVLFHRVPCRIWLPAVQRLPLRRPEGRAGLQAGEHKN